jgi:hypothetical protein
VALQGACDQAVFVLLGVSATLALVSLVVIQLMGGGVGLYCTGRQLNRWTAGTSTFTYPRKMRSGDLLGD